MLVHQPQCKKEGETKMNEKSLLEIAYDVVSASKNPLSFKALWNKVVKEKGLSEAEAADRVSQFYTNLLLDGRFVNLGDNSWDLRARHTFDKVHIDMRDVYTDVEASADDEEEVAEEKLYNEAFEEKQVSRDDEIEFESNEDEDNKDNDNL